MLSMTTSPSRRSFLCGLAGTSAMAIGYLPSAAEAAPTFGRGAISGHPWHSGCGSAGITAFESYRGRKCDTYTLWCKHETWSDITSLIGNLSNLTKLPGRISYGLAPLPKSHSILKNSGNYKLAAKGSFDVYYTQFAQKLAARAKKI
jgi:hypothetical protein